MHELSLMETIRELALQQAQSHGAARIEAVRLRIGSLAGVEPEALNFAFEVLMANTIAAGARLVVETLPAEWFCAPCAQPFGAEDYLGLCPSCGAISRELRQGRELQLTSLELS